MDVIVDGKALRQAVERAAMVAPRKSKLPILGMVQIEARGLAATVSATDLYQSIRTPVDCATTTDGCAVLPPKPLREFLRGARDGEMFRISAPGHNVTIAAVDSRRRLAISPDFKSDDFPKLPAVPSGEWRELPESFGHSLRQVAPCISCDDTRPHVNSMLLRATGEKLVLVATDGHRMAMADLRWPGQFESDLLIPQNAITVIAKLLSGSASARIAVTKPIAHVLASGSILSVKLVDATFPPFEQIIPRDEGSAIVHVERAALLSVLASFRKLINGHNHSGVKVCLAGGKLALDADMRDGASVADEIQVDYDGPEKATGINAGYLVDALRAIDTDSACLMLRSDLDPTTLLSDSGRFFSLVMPLRI